MEMSKVRVSPPKLLAAVLAMIVLSLGLFAITSMMPSSVKQAYAISESEPNDSFATADRISMGDTVHGCMYDKYNENDWNWEWDDDYYRIYVPASGRVKITLRRTAFSGAWSELCLYDYHLDLVDKIIGSEGLAPDSKIFSLKKGTYYIKMYMWCGGACGPYKFKITYVIDKPSTVKTAPSKTSMTLKWNKVSATGYQVRYSTNKSMSGAKVQTLKKNVKTKKITKLKKNKRYYVQVRAYKVISGKTYYSSWSSKKSAKTLK